MGRISRALVGGVIGAIIGGVLGAASVLFFIDGLWIGNGPAPAWLHVLGLAVPGAALGAVVGGIRGDSRCR